MADIFNILTLDVDKRTNIVMTDTYQDIGNVTTATPVVLNGYYELGFSVLSTFDQTTKSEFFRFTIDGGTTWHEFRQEPKDIQDSTPLTYSFPKQMSVVESRNIILQARKEDSAGIMNIKFSDVWIKRIG